MMSTQHFDDIYSRPIRLVGNVSYTDIARKAKQMEFKRNAVLTYPQMKPSTAQEDECHGTKSSHDTTSGAGVDPGAG